MCRPKIFRTKTFRSNLFWTKLSRPTKFRAPFFFRPIFLWLENFRSTKLIWKIVRSNPFLLGSVCPVLTWFCFAWLLLGASWDTAFRRCRGWCAIALVVVIVVAVERDAQSFSSSSSSSKVTCDRFRHRCRRHRRRGRCAIVVVVAVEGDARSFSSSSSWS